jgi:mannose/fructose/sorbose-specific phosphotransferase system IIA component
MIGIVLAAHGPLPAALLASAGMILGDLPQVATVSLLPGDSLEELVERLRIAANDVNTDDGVLILLDMFGGTPANASTLLTRQMKGVHAVTGVNLPMLLEALMERMGMDKVETLAGTASSAGHTGIVDIVQAFQKFQNAKEDSM